MSHAECAVDVRRMIEAALAAKKTDAALAIWELLLALEQNEQLKDIGIRRNCTTVAFHPDGSNVPEIRCVIATLKRTAPANCSESLRRLVFGNCSNKSGNGNSKPECHSRRSRTPRKRANG